MNHDATHCADWQEAACPESCYRAQLAKDLSERRERGELFWIQISYAHLSETDLCPERRRRVSIERQKEYMERIDRAGRERARIDILLEAARDDELTVSELIRVEEFCLKRYPGKTQT